jgi:hypothetical protein
MQEREQIRKIFQVKEKKRSLCKSVWVDKLRSLKANTTEQANNMAKKDTREVAHS